LRISELRFFTLPEISHLMARGDISSVELVNLVLDQINRTDGQVRAYVTICRESALAAAEIKDKELRQGKSKQVLHGIPVSFKDNFETEGIRTTCSSKILRNYIPKKDATAVARLKEAGAIILGKLNTHEFAQGPITPPTRNPWNLDHIPGGSSGGSGAAVAATSALVALGSDTGGSIRMPAAFCGVVGFKPTFGLVSKFGLIPARWTLDHVGPICRRVEDAAMLTMLMAGKDPLDLSTVEQPVQDYFGAVKKGVKGVRLGIPKNHFFTGCDGRISKSVRRAIDDLLDLGCVPVEFHFPDISKMLAARLVIDSCESSAFHSRWLRTSASQYQPDVRAALEQGSKIPATEYIQAMRYQRVAVEKIVPLFREFDIMITPIELMLASKIGEKVNDDKVMHCTGAFNFLGLPAVTVPCGFADGLPIGAQMIGNLFDDARVLGIANAYEKISKHYLKVPPIS